MNWIPRSVAWEELGTHQEHFFTRIVWGIQFDWARNTKKCHTFGRFASLSHCTSCSYNKCSFEAVLRDNDVLL